MIRAENPAASGAVLLGKSTAKPGNVDMSIFEKKSGAGGAQGQAGQGAVDPNYLKKCREDNPEPAAAAGGGTAGAGAAPTASKVALSNCRFTDPATLRTDGNFECACDVQKISDPSNFTVFFKLFCSIVQPDGTVSPPQFMNHQIEGKANTTDAAQTVLAYGQLLSPTPPVRRGTQLKYHLVAEHWDCTTTLESPKYDIVNDLLPKPVTHWWFDPLLFDFDSTFILPGSQVYLPYLKKMYDDNPETLLAIFGHADPVGNDEYNKTLSARRARALYALVTRNQAIWIDLSKKTSGDDWGTKSNQMMLGNVKDATGTPYYQSNYDGISGPLTIDATKRFQRDNGLKDDGVIGQLTKEKLFPAYMDAICIDEAGTSYSIPPERFMGDATENVKVDSKGTGAYQGCSELNPRLLNSVQEDKKLGKKARDEFNQTNRRCVVAFFKKDDFSDTATEKPQWPCPLWTAKCTECDKEKAETGDLFREMGDEVKMYPLQQTMACMFYHGVAEKNTEGTNPKPVVEIKSEDGSKPAPDAVLSGRSVKWKAVPGPDDIGGGSFLWRSTSPRLELTNELTDTITIRSKEGETSDPGKPEEITLEFRPAGIQSPLVLTFPLSVFQLKFGRSPNQSYGFDDMSTTAGTAGPRPHRLSVSEGFPTVVQLELTGGSVAPAAFEFKTFAPTIATVAPPTGAGPTFDLTVTGGASGATELSATHISSGTPCGGIEVRTYKPKEVNAMLVKLEDPRPDRTASLLANPGYSIPDGREAINKSYQNAVVKLELLSASSGVKANGAINCEFAETDGFLLYTLNENSPGYQKIVDLCAGLHPDTTNMVFAVVVKKLLTMCYLKNDANPGDNILTFTDNNKPSLKYFKAGRAYNLRSNTGDIEVVYVDPSKTVEGSGDLWVQRGEADTSGIVGTFPSDGKHGLEFPALGWSGWPGQPIIVVEDIDEKSLSMIVGHELGHSRMHFFDVDDLQSMMNSFGRAYVNQEQFQLRYIQAQKSYPPAPGEDPTESQWEAIAR